MLLTLKHSNVEEFDGLAEKVRCFVDDPSAGKLIDAIRDLTGLYEEHHPCCEEVPSLRSALSRCPEDRIRKYAEQCGELAEMWMESRFHDNPLQEMKDEEFDAESILSFKDHLTQLKEAEDARRLLIQQPSRGNDVADAEDLKQWLLKHRATFLGISDESATRISRLYSLFESKTKRKSKGVVLLAQARDYSERLAKFDLSNYSEAIGRLVPAIPSGELVYWLKAAAYFVKKPSVLGKLNNPARLLAIRRAKRLLTLSAFPSDDKNIQLLGEALFLEGQTLDIRRDWRPIIKLDDADESELMSLIDLKESIDSAKSDLETTQQIFDALASFPIRIKIDAEKLNNAASFRSLVRAAETAGAKIECSTPEYRGGRLRSLMDG